MDHIIPVVTYTHDCLSFTDEDTVEDTDEKAEKEGEATKEIQEGDKDSHSKLQGNAQAREDL